MDSADIRSERPTAALICSAGAVYLNIIVRRFHTQFADAADCKVLLGKEIRRTAIRRVASWGRDPPGYLVVATV